METTIQAGQQLKSLTSKGDRVLLQVGGPRWGAKPRLSGDAIGGFFRGVILAVMLTPSLVAEQELNDLSMGAEVEPSPVALGLAAILAGDFATALRMLTPLAKDGNAKAQVYLGIMYDDGEGVA